MKVSLIITTYNSPQFLELVLKSVLIQTYMPDEIVIADDGSKSEIVKLNKKHLEKLKLNYKYVWQEDKGFRAALIRNKAVLSTTGDYIIGIDGDMVLDKNFIKDHLKYAEKNVYIQGKRVLLNSEITKKALITKNINFKFFSKGLKNRKNAIHSDILARIFSKTNNSLKGIKTCNFSMFKEDILKINGFNNEFIGWGREDSEFLARFLNSGGKRFDLMFNAIAYHLYHPDSYKTIPEKNEFLLQEAIKKKLIMCENGIKQLRDIYES
jgi:glycosyltransferase involved in cell wall biosynthesis